MAIAALAYFAAAPWEPCNRGRQALLVVLLFNLWTILPLAQSSAASGDGSGCGASSSSRPAKRQAGQQATTPPFWSPPAWLRQGTAAARGLVRGACVALPGCVMSAKLLPEGDARHVMLKRSL